jgi:hypothetical protein
MGGMRALVAAVVLGGVFGAATATVESIDDGVMVVSIEVEVSGSPESVVAHLSFEDDPPLTLPMLARGDDLYGLRTDLPGKNYFVVFEILGEPGHRSDPVSLVQMGAELGPGTGSATTTTMDDDELSEESQRMLWLAVALAAASLSLLAFWVLGDRDDEAAADDETRDEGAVDQPATDEEE